MVNQPRPDPGTDVDERRRTGKRPSAGGSRPQLLRDLPDRLRTIRVPTIAGEVRSVRTTRGSRRELSPRSPKASRSRMKEPLSVTLRSPLPDSNRRPSLPFRGLQDSRRAGKACRRSVGKKSRGRSGANPADRRPSGLHHVLSRTSRYRRLAEGEDPSRLGRLAPISPVFGWAKRGREGLSSGRRTGELSCTFGPSQR